MKITVMNQSKKMPSDLVEACKGNEILARIFYNRNIRSAEELLNFTDYDQYKPYNPLDFPGMESACKIISEAIDKKEKIAVYGDYDVDGITATSVLILGLRELGTENTVYHVPDRFSEGYGMNMGVVEELFNEGTKLIITCDCGIANFNEISRAKELGMTVILTDHHTIGESLPSADIVINPKILEEDSPIRNVSGCATAYLLIKALSVYLKKNISDCTDLVALSIIADVIPLRDESRYLFNMGFGKLTNPTRLGLNKLIEKISYPIESAEDIGFQIAPRINAVGRMNTAKLAVELFLTENEKEAEELAEQIDRYNSDRKNIQKDIYEQAKNMVETEKKNKKILILYGENWHHGIIGIVAGRICEEYGRPCIVLSLGDDGTTVVGSARSTEYLNIYDTLTKFGERLVKFGGHSQAAGLSLKLENLKQFTQEIEDYADMYLSDKEKVISVDALLPFTEINQELYEELKLGEPYGADFELPLFATVNVRITKEVINSEKHHFLTLMDETKHEIGTTLWNYGTESIVNKECTIIYSIYKDTYKERNEIKIKIDRIAFEPVKIQNNIVERIDRKNVKIEKVIGEFRNAAVFYEGPITFKPEIPTIDSDFDEKVSTLILYSLPKSNRILDKLIEQTYPEKLVFNYSYVPNYDMETFEVRFLGVIKGLANRNENKILISRFAQIMLVADEFIEVYCKYVKEMVGINYSVLPTNEISFDMETIAGNKKYDGELKVRNSYLEKNITRYLREKEEYVKYMLEAEIN